MWKKIDSPSAEGSPIVTRYNYATGQYMRPSQYGDYMRNQHLSGLDMQTDNWNTRMGVKGNSPMRNYMVGNGNSPMDRGGANMFPSTIQGYQYLTTGGYPPPSAMPQNSNVYPAMFNHQNGQRIDPQSNNGLISPVFKDHHFNGEGEVGVAQFGGLPEYLRGQTDGYGSSIAFVDVKGTGGVYEYRIYSDNRVVIIRKNGVPANITVPSGSSAWTAIINQVGDYKANTGQSTPPIQTGRQGLDTAIAKGQEFAQSEQGKSVIASIFDTFLSRQGATKSQYDLQSQQAQAQAQTIAQGMQPSAFQKALPYIATVSVIGMVGTAVYFSTKGK